jgi:CO/xanthine dehydrogenase Mo-binding subunit
LLEHYQYDKDGQPLNINFTDYVMPRIGNLPPQVRIGHLVTPSPYTEYGVKGAGEGGRMVAPPAVACAIEDALRPLGVRIDTLPVTPSRLRALIREAEAKKGAR